MRSVQMLHVLARLCSIEFHGLTNVNIHSNYSTWVKCSRNLGRCPSSLTSSTSCMLFLTGVPIEMGMRSGTMTVHLLPPWRRGRRRIVSGWSNYYTNLRTGLTRKISNTGPWSWSSLSMVFFTVQGNNVKSVLACQNHLFHLIWAGCDWKGRRGLADLCRILLVRVGTISNFTSSPSCCWWSQGGARYLHGGFPGGEHPTSGKIAWWTGWSSAPTAMVPCWRLMCFLGRIVPHGLMPTFLQNTRKRLAGASSARKDGRHYALSCRHFLILETC